MADIVFYLGTEREDFSVISATFRQFARVVELHFITTPEEVLARIEAGSRPSLIFAGLPADPAPVLEFLQHLKSHDAGRWIPVVLIGHGEDHWKRNEVISAGAGAFLRSPLQPEALQRLFSATGELLIRPDEDIPLLVASHPLEK